MMSQGVYIQVLKEKIDTLDPQTHKALRDALTAKYNYLIYRESRKKVKKVNSRELYMNLSITGYKLVELFFDKDCADVAE